MSAPPTPRACPARPERAQASRGERATRVERACPERAKRVEGARGAVLMLFVGVLAGVVLVSPRAPVAAAGTGLARLQSIGVRGEGPGRLVQIETSEPVAYVTSQPDPTTVLVDLRNVRNEITAPLTAADPFADIRVEPARAADGTELARVRLALNEPGTARVRSNRNLILVELDQSARPAAGQAVKARPARSAGVATSLRSVSAASTADGTTLTFTANGRLIASSIDEAKDDPPRVVFDFPGVSPDAPETTDVAQGPVSRVRVAANSRQPLVTRVVVDLSRRAVYRVDSAGVNGEQLVVTFPANQPAPARATVPVAGAPAAPAALPDSMAQVPSVQAAGIGNGASKFTGHPVSLDFQGADLRAVLRTFSEISALNVVIDPSIQGTVDVALRDVPWDQALDIILRANKLGYVIDGTIVRIAPLSVLADEQAQHRKLQEEQKLSGQLQVLTRSLSYAKAADIAPLLTKTVLTQRGTIETDPRTNTLIITDLAPNLLQATELITTLDKAQPQVEIEARIVQTTRDFARSLGIQWGFSGRAAPDLGNTMPFAFPNQGSVTGRTGGSQGIPSPAPATDATSTAVNLGVNAATSAIGISMGAVNGAVNLDIALSALERSGNGRLLSTPRVSTQNNIEAEITQGVQIPIQVVANNTITVMFKDAALTLKVTPQITAANTVIMRIFLENASPDFSRSVNSIPPIDTQRAVSQVLVNDGETTVIGGIYVSREQATNSRTPGLSRIPLLGWLFKRDEVTDENRELLIFITPRIIRS